VIVWDRGAWEPHATDDPAAAVEAGELHADVHGQKLRGRLILVRRDKNRPGSGASDQWLLMHKHDEYAVKGWDPGDYPRSVLSGRTNDEVNADPARIWRSDLPPPEASVPVRRPGSGPPDSLAAGPSHRSASGPSPESCCGRRGRGAWQWGVGAVSALLCGAAPARGRVLHPPGSRRIGLAPGRHGPERCGR
jgi:bifunctional non-homologous end joining protein LigD